jgi:general secretion pathway protein K
MNRLSRQRGSAIIIALFVMSLAAIISVSMLSRSSIATRRTVLMLNADQSQLYAQASVNWAIDLLKNNLKQQKTGRLTDTFPIQSKTDTVNGYVIESSIEDMQGYFNLNNLTKQDYQKNFLRLITAVDPKLNLSDMTHIILAASDWIGPGKSETLNAYYGKLNPPYRAPHKAMASVSELRLVRGMTPEIYNELLPYITALPIATQINVNTAPAMVIMSLSKTLTPEGARTIEARRKAMPFIDAGSFMNFDLVKNNQVTADQITVLSSYFLVKTSVKVGRQQTVLYTLLNRVTKNSKPDVIVVWQTKGTL